MNALLSDLRSKLSRSKRYRDAFAASVAKRMIPLQIRVLRNQRGWSQARLAEESRLTQGVISRAQDPEYGNLTINTLVRIAAGFDCAYIGRFVPFSELGKWYIALEDENSFRVSSFADDVGFIERKMPLLDVVSTRLLATDDHALWKPVTIKPNLRPPGTAPRIVESGSVIHACPARDTAGDIGIYPQFLKEAS
jgi:transcriptional regulator with XRE-family HTH domain